MAKKARKKAARKRTTRKRSRTGTQVSMFGRTTKRARKKGVGKRTKRALKADRKRTALPPGRRVSRRGKLYTERRVNRAD